jgi:hypothetical protein
MESMSSDVDYDVIIIGESFGGLRMLHELHTMGLSRNTSRLVRMLVGPGTGIENLAQEQTVKHGSTL